MKGIRVGDGGLVMTIESSTLPSDSIAVYTSASKPTVTGKNNYVMYEIHRRRNFNTSIASITHSHHQLSQLLHPLGLGQYES